MKLFDKNKKYVFDRHRYSGTSSNWLGLCDGQEVKVINEIRGEFKVGYCSFRISADWCNEVKI